MLFSATQTRNVEDLARISLKKAPLYVGVDDNKDTSTVEGLEQVRGCKCYVRGGEAMTSWEVAWGLGYECLSQPYYKIWNRLMAGFISENITGGLNSE